jgi:hypothetical protein
MVLDCVMTIIGKECWTYTMHNTYDKKVGRRSRGNSELPDRRMSERNLGRAPSLMESIVRLDVYLLIVVEDI